MRYPLRIMDERPIEAHGQPDTGLLRIVRATIVGLLLMPVCCYWAQDQTVDRIFSLMVPPIVLTLIVAVANRIVRMRSVVLAMSEGELVIVYAMLTVGCAMASEWMDVIAPYIHSYGLYADRNERYRSKVLPYVSNLLFFKDASALEGFAAGGKPFWYFVSQLPLWWPKILAWTAIISLVCLAMLCINMLMRDQWTHRERLAFPIIQLPVAIVSEGSGGGGLRGRYVLGAMGVMLAIDLLNGFAFRYPVLPRINVRFLGDMSQWFTVRPWNQVGWTPIGIFPYMAAIGLFMPTDLLFSCIFFFFVRKGMQVVAAALGNEQGVFGGGGLVPSPPYFSEQSWGAFFGLFCTAIWVSRGYLREVWAEIVHGGGEPRGVPHRISFILLLLSLGLLGWIGYAIGLPWYFVIGYTIVFLAFSVAITRLRAQLGPPTHEMAFMGPNQLLVDFRGSQGLGESFIARTVTTFHFMNRIHRTHPMPHQLESIKMGAMARVNQRAIFTAIVLATLAGSIFGHLVRIYLGYRWTPGDYGGDTAGVIAQLTDSPRPYNIAAITAIVLSFSFVLLLDMIRFRIPGFPLHPAGYALTMNFGVDYYWFGLIIVLLVKTYVQRYYGLAGYDKLRMVALGILLGEFVAEGIWGTVAMITREATYSISINGRLGWTQ